MVLEVGRMYGLIDIVIIEGTGSVELLQYFEIPSTMHDSAAPRKSFSFWHSMPTSKDMMVLLFAFDLRFLRFSFGLWSPRSCRK